MPALGLQFAQTLLLARKWCGGLGSQRRTKSFQHSGIASIRFGQDASATRVLTHPYGLHQRNCKLSLSQALQQSPLVAATGLADSLHRRSAFFDAGAVRR